MADWRWVTVVTNTFLGGAAYPEHQAQWINFDSVDIVRPLSPPRQGANTLLIGMDPINRMLIVEKIDPQSRASNNQQQPTTEE
jgi:hypothetical protein